MNFNLGKCQILHFGRDRQDTVYSLRGYPPAAVSSQTQAVKETLELLLVI